MRCSRGPWCPDGLCEVCCTTCQWQWNLDPRGGKAKESWTAAALSPIRMVGNWFGVRTRLAARPSPFVAWRPRILLCMLQSCGDQGPPGRAVSLEGHGSGLEAPTAAPQGPHRSTSQLVAGPAQGPPAVDLPGVPGQPHAVPDLHSMATEEDITDAALRELVAALGSTGAGLGAGAAADLGAVAAAACETLLPRILDRLGSREPFGSMDTTVQRGPSGGAGEGAGAGECTTAATPPTSQDSQLEVDALACLCTHAAPAHLAPHVPRIAACLAPLVVDVNGAACTGALRVLATLAAAPRHRGPLAVAVPSCTRVVIAHPSPSGSTTDGGVERATLALQFLVYMHRSHPWEDAATLLPVLEAVVEHLGLPDAVPTVQQGLALLSIRLLATLARRKGSASAAQRLVSGTVLDALPRLVHLLGHQGLHDLEVRAAVAGLLATCVARAPRRVPHLLPLVPHIVGTLLVHWRTPEVHNPCLAFLGAMVGEAPESHKAEVCRAVLPAVPRTVALLSSQQLGLCRNSQAARRILMVLSREVSTPRFILDCSFGGYCLLG
jgi:hypothetical protein